MKMSNSLFFSRVFLFIFVKLSCFKQIGILEKKQNYVDVNTAEGYKKVHHFQEI